MSNQRDDLPNSVESERLLLGSVLGNPGLLETVRALKPSDFYNEVNGKIFAAMLDTVDAEESLDDIGLKARVATPAVTLTYLNELRTEAGFGLLSIGQDVKRIVETSRRREIQRVLNAAAEMVHDSSADEVLAFTQGRIDQLKQQSAPAKRRQTMAELVDDQAERYRHWFKGISNAIPTGFAALDERLMGGGMVRSGLYILAAQTSMGKTAMAIDVTANVAAAGLRAHYVTREMQNASLFDRLHAANAQVARWKLRPGIYQSDYNRLLQTLPAMGELPITLDNESRSIRDIKTLMRDLARKDSVPDLLVVDYIQQIEGIKGRSRSEEVGSVTRSLKSLALEYNLAIIGLSQLSRESAKQHREPELTDLRDSGEIEQDADAVFFLFGDRPEEGAKFYNRGFKCAKQREGALFRHEFVFNGELVTFRSIEQLMVSGVHDYTEATQ